MESLDEENERIKENINSFIIDKMKGTSTNRPSSLMGLRRMSTLKTSTITYKSAVNVDDGTSDVMPHTFTKSLLIGQQEKKNLIIIKKSE